MMPFRFSVMTCNLWGLNKWRERQAAVKELLDVFRPDVFSVQELTPETQTFIDKALPYHKRVDDELPGWATEGNIFWDGRLFEKVEHGAEDIGLLEADRRLFWVRLVIKNSDQTVFISTAHYTWKAHPIELETGTSPRLLQSRLTGKTLKSLARNSEPVLFMGDLNDSSHPTFILNDAGYRDCFSVLGVPAPPTAPCYPTVQVGRGRPMLNQTLDWIMSNEFARPMAAQVPYFYHNGVTPSDHWPVLAVYEVTSIQG